MPTIIYSEYSVTHVSDCVYVIKSKDLLRFVSATARCHFEALFNAGFKESDIIKQVLAGAPNENIVQNHFNTTLLNVFSYFNDRYRHIFIP